MEQNFIKVSVVDNVAILELDDPSANTLTFHLLEELEARFLLLESDPEIKGIVLTGNGDKFFSGGVNIGMLLTAGEKHNSHFILYAAEVLEYIESSPLPVVAAINGNITGGGLELALISDYRIAVSGTYNIGFPEVRLGVIPGMGGTQRLSRLVGAQRALEMISQGVFVGPDSALEIGLVDQVVDAENYKTKAVALAVEFINQHPAEEKNDLNYSPSWNPLEELIEAGGILTYHVENGVGSIEFVGPAPEYPPEKILSYLNQALLQVRGDDAVFVLNIHIPRNVFSASWSDLSFTQKRFFDAVMARVEGYPRLVSLSFSNALGDLESRIALACDYRVYQGEAISDKQVLSINERQEMRFSALLPKVEKQSLSISDYIDSGLFLTKPSLSKWLSRFVPPSGAAQAIGYAKLAITQGFDKPLAASLLLERHLQEQLFSAVDSQEGMTAYLEKRPANFKGN